MKTQILNSLFLSVICGVSIGFASEIPAAEQPPSTTGSDPIVTYRKVHLNESLSELGSRLYKQVDYELELRQLTREIRVAEAELELQRERLRVYDKYFGYTDALLVTRQNAKLEVVRREEQLKLLRRAKLLALRHRNDRLRYRKLLLASGAARLQLAE